MTVFEQSMEVVIVFENASVASRLPASSSWLTTLRQIVHGHRHRRTSAVVSSFSIIHRQVPCRAGQVQIEVDECFVKGICGRKVSKIVVAQ